MALTGNFRETSFADLIQFYGISKQTVAVAVRLSPGNPEPDGLFYFEEGDLVGAHLAGVEGREALRRALRLRQGTFTTKVGARLPGPVERAPWRQVLMEEMVQLDEEHRPGDGPRNGAAGPAAMGAPGAPSAGAQRPNGVAKGQVRASLAEPTPPPQRIAVPTPPPQRLAERTPPPRPLRDRTPAPHVPAERTPAPPLVEPTPRPSALAAGAAGPAPAGGAPRGGSRPPGSPPAGTPPRGPKRPTILLGAAGVVVIALVAVVFSQLGKVADPSGAVTSSASPRKVRGVTSTEIVFGMSGPFSGATKELGRAMKAGIETAFAALNESGGIHGRKLRLVAADDGYEPARTGEVMKRLVEAEGVFAIVGNGGTATAAVSIPYCQEQKVVFFGALTGGDLLRKSPPDRYVFNYRPSYAEETAAAVRYLTEVRRVDPHRIAVFAQSDGFGESGWSGAARQLEQFGVDPQRVPRMGYARNTADVQDAARSLESRSSDVDAVVMVATYRAAADLIRKARDAGIRAIFTNVSAVDSNALADELAPGGKRYTQDVIVTQTVPLPTSQATAVTRYRAALAKHAQGEQPGFITLEGWVVGNLLAEGLRRAGPDLDTEKLVAALEDIRDLDLGIGTRINFGPQEHQGSHKVWGTALQPDGSYAAVDLE